MPHKPVLFASDLHLESDHCRNAKQLLELLENAHDYEAVYLLGDVFDLWLGAHDTVQYLGIFNALKIASGHCNIFFMPGNHDFLLQTSICEQYGITWIPDPYLTHHHDKKLLLTHGDLLCTDDIGYQRMRRVIQHPVCIQLFHWLPLKAKQYIASWLKKQSRSKCQNKPPQQFNIPESTLLDWQLQHQYDAIIHGHIHQEYIDHSSVRYSLGDWHQKPSQLWLKKGQLEFIR